MVKPKAKGAKPKGKRQPNKKPAPRRTQTRITAAREMLRHESQMASYLHGLVDPDHPARGPGGWIPSGTEVINQKSVRSIQFTPARPAGDRGFGNGAEHYDSTTNFMVPDSNYYLDDASSVAIVVQPSRKIYHDYSVGPNLLAAIADGGDDITGWTTSPNALNNNRIVSSVTSDIDACNNILPNMTWPFPSTRTIERPDPAGPFPLDPGQYTEYANDIPRRCVGLTAELTVIQPALDAQGIVYAGNNQDFVPNQERPNMVQEGNMLNFGTHSQESNVHDKYLNDPDSYRSMHVVGAFKTGARYTATWLPKSDMALRFMNSQIPYPTPDTNTAGPFVNPQQMDGVVAASLLANSPAVMFVLKGLNTASSLPSISLSVTVNWEVGIRPSGSLGFLIANARLCSRYLVDWNRLGALTAGNSGGSILSQGSNDLAIAVGRAHAKGLLPAVDLPRAAGLSASIPTQHSVSADSKAAQAATAVKSGLVSLESGAQSVAKIVNATGETLSAFQKIKAMLRKGEHAFQTVEGYVGPVVEEVEEVAMLL